MRCDYDDSVTYDEHPIEHPVQRHFKSFEPVCTAEDELPTRGVA